MVDNLNIALIFVAGLASVLSPCVLPVLPIVVTGTSEDHRLRPLLIVAGLAIAFMAMGAVSSLFGAAIGSHMRLVEKVTGWLIVAFGLLLVLNVNLFKHLSFLSGIRGRTSGPLGGLLLGMLLGVIWIPCVGPMLAGVLAIVATQGKVLTGILLLFVYSVGFAIPMLLAGYAAFFFRKRLRGIGQFPYLVSAISGAILIAMGLLIVFKGMLGFGSLL